VTPWGDISEKYTFIFDNIKKTEKTYCSQKAAHGTAMLLNNER